MRRLCAVWLLACTWLLAACATGWMWSNVVWVTNDFDPAKDPRRFQRDYYECRVVTDDMALVTLCMNSKGYTRTYR